tara:strand:+ start:1094 stop:1777 length:684 start_codon:yes stop_codon:yes gene_type:complete
LKVLDLGCRTGSAVAAWQSRGHTVVGVDWEDHGQQIQGDFTKYETWEIIDNVTPIWEKEVRPYDFIWFSPDCSIFSMANMRWDVNINKQFEPVSDRAIKEVEGIKFVLDRIQERSPRLGWVMENPRALMRKMDFTQDLHRATVTYCQYGDERMKPTDLFGQLPYSFVPKACRNGDSCHIPAPRGSRTGTQGMSKTEAGRIPFALSLEIMLSAIESGGRSIPTLKEWI